MILIPDPQTAIIEEFGEEKVLSMICDVHDATSGEPSIYDPRNILKQTLKSIEEIADNVYFGPEYEFHIFEDVRYSISNNDISVKIDSSLASVIAL